MGTGPAAVIKEENVMPCYLYQASYTGAAIKTLVGNPQDRTAVSYTHLTLPTIYSV